MMRIYTPRSGFGRAPSQSWNSALISEGVAPPVGSGKVHWLWVFSLSRQIVGREL